jgi:hypothetical protein
LPRGLWAQGNAVKWLESEGRFRAPECLLVTLAFSVERLCLDRFVSEAWFSGDGTGSSFEVTSDSGSRESELQSIVVPPSVVVSGERSFHECESLGSVAYESGSRLEGTGESAFS